VKRLHLAAEVSFLTKEAAMKSQNIDAAGPLHTRVLVLESGEEAFSSLQSFAREAGITAASLTAIGALERATVGWFDFSRKTYKEIAVDEQCEVLSAIGDVALGDDGKASLHVHVVLGLSDGSTRGGHLLRGTVHPTLEVVLTDTPAKLRRRKRADLGIALIDADPRRYLEQ
jgi:predicted DNA-binding protein with PD1-like motif